MRLSCSSACNALVGQRSRRRHVDGQLETSRPKLILKSQAHKLGLALMQSLGETSRSFRTHTPAPLLNIAEMGPGNAEKLGKGRETHFIGFSNARERSSKR